MKDWVSQLGLEYSGDLVCRHSTHLVCKNLLASFNEPKYVKSVHWGITIVSFSWVYDSLRAGQLLPTAGYKSDNPGPAAAALREAASLYMRLAALQPVPRAPLGQLSANISNGRGLLGCGTSGMGKDGQPHNETALVKCDNGCNHKKRLAGQEQQASIPDDFTFDVPSGSDILTRSPRLCLVANMAQPAQPERAFAVESIAQTAAPEERAQLLDATSVSIVADAVAGPAGHTLSSPDRGQPRLPTPLASPYTIELSASELNSGLTIDAAADRSAHTAGHGGVGNSTTPTSGTSYDNPRVTRRSEAVQPTKLDVPTSSAAPCAGGEVASNSAAGGRDACSPAAGSGKQATIECVDLLTPSSDAPTHNTADPDGGAQDGCQMGATAQIAGSPQHNGPAVLYSGFESLAEVATVTKSRRLVRNDRLSVAVPNKAERAGRGADEEVPLQADAELEDELEDDIEDAVLPAGTVHAVAAAIENPAPESRPGAPLRPSLANPAHSVKDLRSIFQQPQQQQQLMPPPPPQPPQQQGQARSAMDGHDPARLVHVPVPAAAAGSLASEGYSTSAQPDLRHPRQRSQFTRVQQGTQLGSAQRTTGLPPPVSAELAQGEPLRIKPEPGCEAEDGGQVGPVGPGPVARAAAAASRPTQPSVRRRTAALATSSLVSEPQTLGLASRSAGGAAGKAGRSRLGKDAAAGAHQGAFKDLGGAADGYDSASSSGDTPAGLEDLDLGSAGPTPSFDSGARQADRPGPVQQQLALDDRTTPDQEPKGSKHLAGPNTINRVVGLRTGGLTPLPSSQQRQILPGSISDGDSEDEESFAANASSAGGLRHAGAARARGATASAQAARSKLPRRRAGEDSDTQTDTDTPDARVNSDEDGGELMPAQGGAAARRDRESLAESSLSLSQSQSQSQLESGLQLQQWPREPLTEDKTVSKYLRMSVTMAEEYLVDQGVAAGGELISDSQIRVIKAMGRARNHTVAQKHGGVKLKDVKFAEQILVTPLDLLLSCRDRSKCSKCPIIALSSTADGEGAGGRRQVFLAEPVVFYLLPSGEWWLEYYRFYSLSDLRAMATANDRKLTVSTDFCDRRELMRDTDTSHCRIIHVRGNMGVSRTKKPQPPPRGRSEQRPAYCRFMFDTHTGMPLTDQRVADLVIE
ncbi:hypothetical protein PLESTF_001656600 [Pleodorina starrii]|nr:hypothetical protein PLESTF_001656600 [Pleodorina starrii]